MNGHVYTTLFDRSYLAKGICLIESLVKHSQGKCHIHALALDPFTEKYLERYEEFVEVWNLKQIMTGPLYEAKGNRSYKEFCWTLASYFTNFMMEDGDAGFDTDEITYLDSDLYFFSDPQPIFDEIGEKSAGIIPHRFIPSKKALAVNGHYNVGWVTFKGPTGEVILNDWAKDCLAWCKNIAEPTRFADQKYLDYWKKRYG